MSDLMNAALAHASRGWHVFPLRPNDKRPAVRDWQTRATVDRERIARCWSAGPYGIGIACGPSSLVVVDLDIPKDGQAAPADWATAQVTDGVAVLELLCQWAEQPFPAGTYTVKTGRGGTHLYFASPAAGPPLRNTAGTLGWLIDTRAHGGYVVAAGSTAAGRRYVVERDVEPAPLPGWLAQLARPKPLPPQRPVVVDLVPGRRGEYLNAAVRASVDAIRTATDGTLNRTLYGAAVALGQLVAGGALGETEIHGLLLNAATQAGHPVNGARSTIRSGFRAGANRPRSVAA